MVRNWKGYSKQKWLDLLRQEDWEITQESVQDISNHLEIEILKVLQIIAPIEEQLLKNNSFLLPPHLIKMRKRRKNLFKNAQRRRSVEGMKRCRIMDKQIRRLDFQNQHNKIRQKERGQCNSMGSRQHCKRKSFKWSSGSNCHTNRAKSFWGSAPTSLCRLLPRKGEKHHG